jgi:hypothetical protein
MFRVWMEKGFISSSLCSPGRQLSLAPFWWLPWLVCAVVHAHSLVSCLVVCVCKCCALGLDSICGMALLGRDLSISTSYHLFANLPSGYATWHNTCFYLLCVCVQENNLMLQGSWRSSSTRLDED